MQKKILNLILSGVLLLQFSCFSIFTVSTYSFSVGTHPAWRDVCKDYPKNQYNQTVDTNCAFFQLLNDQRVTDGRSSGEKTRIGPNGEHEIKMWHIDQIKGLGKEFANLILARNKEAQKDEYIRSLSDTTNNFLMLNSEEEADRVTSKLLENSPYFKNKGATTSKIEDWKKSVFSDAFITSAKIEDWKKAHEDLVEEYWDKECNWFQKIFSPLCRKKVNKKIKQEFGIKARKQEIKANVYSSTMDQVIYALLYDNYEGKDTLVAQLDFSDDNYNAKVYFTDIGLESKKIRYQDIKPILDVYQINHLNENNKEEL